MEEQNDCQTVEGVQILRLVDAMSANLRELEAATASRCNLIEQQTISNTRLSDATHTVLTNGIAHLDATVLALQKSAEEKDKIIVDLRLAVKALQSDLRIITLALAALNLIASAIAAYIGGR